VVGLGVVGLGAVGMVTLLLVVEVSDPSVAVSV
jgi:hypothetical protein